MARSGSAGAGTLDLAHLQAKLGVLDRERQKVVDQIRQVINRAERLIAPRGAANRGRTTPSGGAVARKRNRLSPAARKRISEAQKKRWAAQRASNKSGRG